MDKVKEFLQGAELGHRAAALLALVACVSSMLLVRRVRGRREAEDKMRRARDQRAGILRRAERAVLRYRESVS